MSEKVEMLSNFEASCKKKFDHAFGFGITVGFILGAAVICIASLAKEYVEKKNLIKKGVAEYRIDKRTGDTSFHIFQIESGKVVN